MTGSPIPPALVFFNEREARFIDALSARIIPGNEHDPGAREARAVVFIDGTLAGANADLQPLYRSALRELDELCEERHGRPFIELSDDEQDSLLTEISDTIQMLAADHAAAARSAGGSETVRDAPPTTRDERLAFFFTVVREHVVQGTFCDPVYGGNHNGVGWKLVGFPGAYWGYPEHQGKRNFDAAQLPIMTLADLQREHLSNNPGHTEGV
jgi:gluconate 2-dehydrogenase gamma chain